MSEEKEIKKQEKCPHDKLELLGTERTERGENKYYRCLRCGNVLILSNDWHLYEVPGVKEEKRES